jgi:hypothetical protein
LKLIDHFQNNEMGRLAPTLTQVFVHFGTLVVAVIFHRLSLLYSHKRSHFFTSQQLNLFLLFIIIMPRGRWYYDPAPRGRPRNIGRALVAAGVRELEEEEREQKRAKAATLADKTNAAPTAVSILLSNDKASITLTKRSGATQPQSRIAKKKYRYAHLPIITKPVLEHYTKYVPVSYSGPTLWASAHAFSHFLTWFRVNAAQMAWKITNAMTHHDTPKNLDKHTSNSILVFSLKHSNHGRILVGASMFRKASILSGFYTHEGDALLEIALNDAMIVRRWTNWCPPAGDDMRTGIYAIMFRLMMIGNKDQISIYEDSQGFDRAQVEGNVDFRQEYALSLFEADQHWLK